MPSMRRHVSSALALLTWFSVAAAVAQDQAAPPGSPAPPQTVAEIREVVEAALARFHAMDQAGLLAMVSAQYRTDTLTKAGVAEQLRTVFTLHDQVRVRVRIDDIRMVGEH